MTKPKIGLALGSGGAREWCHIGVLLALADEGIEPSIKQQEVLSQESDHRMLNGLQMISSLLSMQSRVALNAEAASQLDAAAGRVAMIGRIQSCAAMPERELKPVGQKSNSADPSSVQRKQRRRAYQSPHGRTPHAQTMGDIGIKLSGERSSGRSRPEYAHAFLR